MKKIVFFKESLIFAVCDRDCLSFTRESLLRYEMMKHFFFNLFKRSSYVSKMAFIRLLKFFDYYLLHLFIAPNEAILTTLQYYNVCP